MEGQERAVLPTTLTLLPPVLARLAFGDYSPSGLVVHAENEGSGHIPVTSPADVLRGQPLFQSGLNRKGMRGRPLGYCWVPSSDGCCGSHVCAVTPERCHRQSGSRLAYYF